jgi:lipopolysaccharide export system protein LptA
VERYTTSSLSCTVVFALLVAAGSVWGEEQKGVDEALKKLSAKGPGEKRGAFEEAMKKIVDAERKQAAEKSLKEWRKTVEKNTQKKLRDFVDKEADDLAKGAVKKTDIRRVAARDFASAAAGKVPEDVEKNFKSLLSGARNPPLLLDPDPDGKAPPDNPNKAGEVLTPLTPGKVLPPPPPLPETGKPVVLTPPPSIGDRAAILPLPDVPQENALTAENPLSSEIAGHGQPENRTVIDADGSVIFDGSGRFGEEYQAVIFEENVVVTNPEFTMTSDYLTAFFRKSSKPQAADDSSAGGSEDQASRLDRAVATGKEVTVRKTIADGELQVAKSRKATFFARDPKVKGSFDEVVLEIWPRVQRGNNLIIAKSKDTVIILRRDEMIVNGPVRTEIVGGDGLTPGSGKKEAEEEKEDSDVSVEGTKTTVIDAVKGAIFNRLDPVTRHREMFFEGDVKIADPQFDISCETLTAYMRFATGDQGLYKAVASGVPGKRVRVERRVDSGEMQLGLAQEVTYVISSGDVVLDVWPEIRRGNHSSVAKRRDARIVMKKNGSVESRGVDIQIVPDSNGGLRGVNRGGESNRPTTN